MATGVDAGEVAAAGVGVGVGVADEVVVVVFVTVVVLEEDDGVDTGSSSKNLTTPSIKRDQKPFFSGVGTQH